MKTIQLFSSSTCTPCIKAKIMCKSFIESGVMQIINAEDSETLIDVHNIRSLPTFLFFENKKEVDRFVGTNHEVITKIINFLKIYE